MSAWTAIWVLVGMAWIACGFSVYCAIVAVRAARRIRRLLR